VKWVTQGQITQEGNSIPDVARRLRISTKSRYNWRTRYGNNASEYEANPAQDSELNCVKAELKRVTQGHDMLMGAALFFGNEGKKNIRL
jgi:transposase